jgi:MFS family permease
MLEGAGIDNNHYQLFLQGMQNLVSFGGAVIGATFTDRWGRRSQLLVSTGIIIALFAVLTALNASNIVYQPDGTAVAKSYAIAQAEIALVFLFGFTFGVGWTPLQALYPVECLRYESRAKGMGWYNFWVNIAGFYNTVTGIAFSGASWKYYFLFIFWDCFEFAFIYFLFVETKGRTLKELTEIFRGKNRVRRSVAKTEVVVHGNKGVTVLELQLPWLWKS